MIFLHVFPIIAGICSVVTAAERVNLTSRASRPNFLAIFGDDLGWYDTAIYNPKSPTPHLAKLANEGMRLDRHYVFRYCSPTRRSFHSGRFPNRITSVQPDGDKLCSDFLPLNVTILSEKLANGANYTCHFIGKGHLGYQTTDHLPVKRGFATHVGFLGGSEAYSHGGGSPKAHEGPHDLWHGVSPADDLVPTLTYATDYYGAQAVKLIQEHGAAWKQYDKARHLTSNSSHSSLSFSEDIFEPSPLFMYLAIQNVHTPYTLPAPWETQDYPDMWDRTYANMLAVMDTVVANVTQALHDADIWDDTLILFTADNGGVTKGNNHPLRGHKHDPWEGGTRAAAFLSGGLLPDHMRGVPSGHKLVHVADWYPTFLHLAGLGDSANDNASFSGVYHDIDGVNVWPMLSGENNSQPRPITPTSETGLIDTSYDGHLYKIVTLAGQSNYYLENQTNVVPLNMTLPCLAKAQPDPPEPGRTDAIVNGKCVVCNSTMPCLFDLLVDPTESVNIAHLHPKKTAQLTVQVKDFQNYYPGIGSLHQWELDRSYKKIDDVNTYWKGYKGPCYLRKNSTQAPTENRVHLSVVQQVLL